MSPVEVVVTYLRQATGIAALVGDRIDTKHRYGGAGWSHDEPSLILTPSGGPPDLYAPRQVADFDVYAYAPTQYEAMEIWMALNAVMRQTDRVIVGGAVMYALNPEVGPSLVYDSDLGLEVCTALISAQVGELAI